MSLTKQALDESVDITDDREPNFPVDGEPSPTDWAISELFNAIGTLEKKPSLAYPYITDLKSMRERLQKVIDEAVKPF